MVAGEVPDRVVKLGDAVGVLRPSCTPRWSDRSSASPSRGTLAASRTGRSRAAGGWPGAGVCGVGTKRLTRSASRPRGLGVPLSSAIRPRGVVMRSSSFATVWWCRSNITPRQDTTESNDCDANGMAIRVTDRPVDHRATPGGPSAADIGALRGSRRCPFRRPHRRRVARLAPGSGHEDSAERLEKVPADGRVRGRRPTSRRPKASVGCGKTDV